MTRSKGLNPATYFLVHQLENTYRREIQPKYRSNRYINYNTNLTTMYLHYMRLSSKESKVAEARGTNFKPIDTFTYTYYMRKYNYFCTFGYRLKIKSPKSFHINMDNHSIMIRNSPQIDKYSPPLLSHTSKHTYLCNKTMH